MAYEFKSLYAPCCAQHITGPSAKFFPEVDDLLDEIVEYIYETKGAGFQVDVRMIQYFANRFWEGVTEGYGKDIQTLVNEGPDKQMIDSLRSNVWQFSGAKNYSQLRALSNELVGPDGRLRTFNDFRKAAYQINNAHVGPWFRAEYDLCVSGSQMAGKWNDAKTGDVPLLEFDAVLDTHTTQTCRELNGTRKPTSDPFWNIYYPPNHFGERSTVQECYSGAITPDHKITLPDIPKMFQTNLAKDGLIFPTDHPYFKDFPEQARKTAENASKSK